MRILVAAGGTGGHVTPALAVVAELKRIVSELDVRFVCGSRRAELAALRGLDPLALPMRTSRGVGRLLDFARAAGSSALLRAVARARAVLTTGGYTAVPAAALAVLMRRPLIVIEVNAYPGRFCRVFGRLARVVLGGWDTLEKHLQKTCSLRIVGVPVRADLRRLDKEEARAALGVPREARTLLLLGGSQGAAALNLFIAENIARLAGSLRGGLDSKPLHLLGLTGGKHEAELEAACRAAGVGATLLHRSDDVGLFYSAADVAVSRAGASTCAELLHYGLPALLVPLPGAADDHQSHNARATVAVGGGVWLPQRRLRKEGVEVLRRLILRSPGGFGRKSGSALKAALVVAEILNGSGVGGRPYDQVGEVLAHRRAGRSLLGRRAS